MSATPRRGCRALEENVVKGWLGGRSERESRGAAGYRGLQGKYYRGKQRSEKDQDVFHKGEQRRKDKESSNLKMRTLENRASWRQIWQVQQRTSVCPTTPRVEANRARRLIIEASAFVQSCACRRVRRRTSLHRSSSMRLMFSLSSWPDANCPPSPSSSAAAAEVDCACITELAEALLHPDRRALASRSS
eukprot:5985222-Pleurochrysis_carterae.AAC.1